MTHTHAHPVLQPSFQSQITLTPQFYNWKATAFPMLTSTEALKTFFFKVKCVLLTVVIMYL